MDYFSGIWSFLKYPAIDKVHNRACRFYLGLHVKAPIPALQAEIGWMLPKYRHFLNIFKNWNRYNKMDANRITYKVLIWDSEQKFKSSTNKLRNILVRAHFSKRGILKVCKAFLSRICHALVFTQFGYADSKSAPCQALFLVFPFQNCKTKWPPK